MLGFALAATNGLGVCDVAGFEGSIVSKLHEYLFNAQCINYHKSPQLPHIVWCAFRNFPKYLVNTSFTFYAACWIRV